MTAELQKIKYQPKHKKYLFQSLFIILVVIAWEIFAWINPFHWPPARGGAAALNIFGYNISLNYSFLFPPPSAVFSKFVSVIAGEVIRDISGSLRRLIIAYLISIALAIPSGMLIAFFKKAENTIDVLVKILYPIPGIAWLPLAILWFGLGDMPIMFIIFTGAFFTVCINTAAAIKNIDPILLRAAKNLGAKGLNKFFKVIIPAAFPQLLTGLRIAWAYSWRSLAAAEMLIATYGLGFIIEYGRMVHDAAIVMCGMILIGVLGILVDKGIFGFIENLTIKRWGITITKA
ncbi:ABC transporter permease [Candidatus Bathyarchaeota archaeon]|nr:MAG: ABC transporter permease [Candidatus Bathyarchaeota archaeon]